MGIYSNFNTSSFDDGSFEPRNLFAECGETATYEELSLAMVAESEQNYNAIMKAIGLNEVNYFAQNGEEIVYEAGGVSNILSKVKEFFKKLIEKIRQILHAFIAKMASFASNDASFVQKYQKEFSEKWSKVKSDYEFNGYKFTIKTDGASAVRATIKGEVTDTVKACCSNDTAAAIGAATGYSGANLATILGGNNGDTKKALDDIRDNKEDIQDKLRGTVAAAVVTAFGANSISGDSFTASEFSKELFEAFRNGESAKQGIEIKKEFSVADIVGDVKNTDKFKKAAEKYSKAVTDGIKDYVKDLDKLERDLTKIQTGDDMKKANDKTAASNTVSEILGIVSEANSLAKDYSSYQVQANGIVLQALSDKNRQAKAIMVKVIGGGKKVNESAEYGDNEGVTESVNYFDKVVLK